MMGKRAEWKNRIQLNDRTGERLFFLSLIVISMAAFLLVGADGYVLFDDSGSYLHMERYVEGVMPVYPLFLRMNRIVFGENVFLRAVIVEQAVFACVCLIVFTNVVRRQFRLGFPESYVIFLLSLLPFTTDMPEAMTTQEIVTEGIAYAAFYLFMAVLLKAVWEKKFRYVAGLALVTLFLAATRSQLQILFGVCGIIFFYLALTGRCKEPESERKDFDSAAAFHGKKENAWEDRRGNGIGKNMSEERSKKKVLLRILAGAAGCLIIGLAGIWCTSRISVTYQQALARYTQRLQAEIDARAQAEEHVLPDEESTGKRQDSGDPDVMDDSSLTDKTEGTNRNKEKNAEETMNAGDLQSADITGNDADTGTAEAAGQNPVVAGQYTSLIFSRGMYEADYEDYLLFEGEELQELYLYLYETADREGYRYTYARPGLWMWKDIVGGIGAVGGVCSYAQNAYYEERPEIYLSDEYISIRNANQMKIGITLIREHWGRVLYHTLMLLPQAFICTVFFQIARIYLLCHLVTLFLYLSAAALMIWAYADKKVDRAYAEFMSAVLGTNLLMILVISLVFFGQQRYLVYNFGIFYMAYFLLLWQLWKIYGKNWLKKWISRRKS